MPLRNRPVVLFDLLLVGLAHLLLNVASDVEGAMLAKAMRSGRSFELEREPAGPGARPRPTPCSLRSRATGWRRCTCSRSGPACARARSWACAGRTRMGAGRLQVRRQLQRVRGPAGAGRAQGGERPEDASAAASGLGRPRPPQGVTGSGAGRGEGLARHLGPGLHGAARRAPGGDRPPARLPGPPRGGRAAQGEVPRPAARRPAGWPRLVFTSRWLRPSSGTRT